MANVKLKNLRKVYNKDVVAIKGANVTIKDKEFVVLVGPLGMWKIHLAANDSRTGRNLGW